MRGIIIWEKMVSLFHKPILGKGRCQFKTNAVL